MKTYWNYRILEREYSSPTGSYTIPVYGIHEVYYENDKVVSWSENPITLGGFDYETNPKEEMKAELELINKALTKPILIESDLIKDAE